MAIAAPRRKALEATSAVRSHATSDLVWRELEKASFAVLSHVTPAGEVRSSGVVYKAVGKRLYVAVAPASWKARHIAARNRVSVTVPVRRGGVLALVMPIPPATISFQATAAVHRAGTINVSSLSKDLESLLPTERRDAAAIIELVPDGHFLTYGVGVSLMDMRRPDLARAIVPIGPSVAPGV